MIICLICPLKILDTTVKTMARDLSINDKLDGICFDIQSRKIQYFLNEREVLENLTTTTTNQTLRKLMMRDLSMTINWPYMRNGPRKIVVQAILFSFACTTS